MSGGESLVEHALPGVAHSQDRSCSAFSIPERNIEQG